MMTIMAAGKSENSAQTMLRTDSASVILTTVWPVAGSVPEMKPAMPSNRATSEPEMAVPNFCAIVPDEKMRPVDEVPFF